MIFLEIYKLDRIEDGIAVAETSSGAFLRFSANCFPKDAKSGDCFALENGSFVFLPEETEKERKKVFSLLSDLI